MYFSDKFEHLIKHALTPLALRQNKPPHWENSLLQIKMNNINKEFSCNANISLHYILIDTNILTNSDQYFFHYLTLMLTMYHEKYNVQLP